MSDNVKLIINISKSALIMLKESGVDWLDAEHILSAVADGIPVPEREKGEWIELPKALNSNENPCECSNCGHILSFMNGYPKSNFCPNCGAKMKEGE